MSWKTRNTNRQDDTRTQSWLKLSWAFHDDEADHERMCTEVQHQEEGDMRTLHEDDIERIDESRSECQLDLSAPICPVMQALQGGLLRESSPGPLAPEARIIPLDHSPRGSCKS